ncbi:Hypothetical predicted protein [Paramuricea clavata]|uniref:Uncharacterized protein n=1 Tax=Paramuricea clavata TaxID=317549 RepID=A0A7D9HBJ2_PARCT|nr:Hypothetical predicted protein [Paramuricea clavata]
MQNRIAGENKTVNKTLTTYFPPINAKVTEFSTINQYLTYMQKLSNEVNMPYVNVCLDLGAAMNAYKFIWNFPLKFKNVVIHLGDFHFIKENFGVIGGIVETSGFEDVVYQAGVCSYGSLKEIFKENSIAIPDYFYDACIDPIASCAVITENASSLYSEYQAFKKEARNGALGKTAQFWIRTAHLAVQENDFDQRVLVWKFFLPMYFALNKQNYARYASYYVGVLQNIDIPHPGLREMLDKSGLSVQAQDRHPLITATDQRGEQTINRDANAILKWTLNRSEEAKNKAKLFEMAGMSLSNEVYKSLRPSEILKSESYTTSVFNTLSKEYLNPFDAELDTSFLYNLCSGTPMEEDISE